jgi:hypothetical protein
MEPGSAAQTTMLTAQNKAGFAVVWNAFGSAFSTYQVAERGIKRDILQVVFLVPRSAPSLFKRCH